MRKILLASAALLGLAAGPALAAGEDNKAYINQLTSDNVAEQLQENGSRNTATINQLGNNENNAYSEQYRGYDLKTTQTQNGLKNSSRVNQYDGGNSKVEHYQEGNSNYALSTQEVSVEGFLKVTQIGNLNNAVQFQNGFRNTGEIYQGGNANNAKQTQR